MTSHATKKKGSAATDKEMMKKHDEMGKKDIYPEGKPENKQGAVGTWPCQFFCVTRLSVMRLPNMMTKRLITVGQS